MVDFPAPLAPSSATRSPSLDAEAHVPQRAQLAVIDREMRDLEHHAGSFKRAAEIGPQHVLVREHRIRRAIGDDRALLEHDQPVDHLR